MVKNSTKSAVTAVAVIPKPIDHAPILKLPADEINLGWFHGSHLVTPILFDVVALQKGDGGIHVELKRRRGRPRVIQDYGGLSRDEFYRRRYREKQKTKKQAEAKPNQPRLRNSSEKDDIFVIESAPPGRRRVTTGFGIQSREQTSDIFERIGGWSQTNGLLPEHDVHQRNGSNPSVFGFTEINDESEWNDLPTLQNKIAELKISYESHPGILALLELPITNIREILTVTNYKIPNIEGHTGRKVGLPGAGPDEFEASNDGESEHAGGSAYSESEDEDSSENSLETALAQEFFNEQTAVEDGSYRCLICPTLKGGRKCETISPDQDKAFAHFLKHRVRIRAAIAPFLPKKVKEWVRADKRVAGWDDDKVYRSFEWLDPTPPADKAKAWLASRGVVAIDDELVKVHETKAVTSDWIHLTRDEAGYLSPHHT